MNQLVTCFKWSFVLVDQANAELLEFMEMLSLACQHRSMHEAWVFCVRDQESKINWPTIIGKPVGITRVHLTLHVLYRCF